MINSNVINFVVRQTGSLLFHILLLFHKYLVQIDLIDFKKKFCSEFRVSSDYLSNTRFLKPWRKSLLFCMVVVRMSLACLKIILISLRIDLKCTLHLSIFTGRVGIAEVFRKLIACRPISRSCTSSDKVRPEEKIINAFWIPHPSLAENRA